ncbi:hypothetical protein [Ruegeria sp. HKCCD7318]|uniref:hypothetical protein n=1 Tax=Ruegeria sp. HKCCD7318 TaxID=2683014 RepID=UPI0014915351|nr:hypothetical protein [Ruegeria sp. HKCCD7318]NOE35848.1 hypothetical protein [Ruegeria sp. HKCCD7318]
MNIQLLEHGLGLLIVRDIAELYDGSVSIGTSVLGGAKVSVSLPGRIETLK